MGKIVKHKTGEVITLTCKICGAKFDYTVVAARAPLFCSNKCRTKARNERSLGIYHVEKCLKGDKNLLNVIMKELDAKGITYSEFKRERALRDVPKIDVNIGSR